MIYLLGNEVDRWFFSLETRLLEHCELKKNGVHGYPWTETDELFLKFDEIWLWGMVWVILKKYMILQTDFEGKRNLARKSAREKIPALKKKNTISFPARCCSANTTNNERCCVKQNFWCWLVKQWLAKIEQRRALKDGHYLWEEKRKYKLNGSGNAVQLTEASGISSQTIQKFILFI